MAGVLASELRNAIRSLSRAPTVAVSAVVCLALGLGATTSISSALDRAILRPLPFRDPGKLVAVHRVTPQSGPMGTWPQSVANYTDMASRTRRIEKLSAMSRQTALVQLRDGTVQASQLLVTGELLSMLGVGATTGRLIGADDDRLDRPAVAVLSLEFWQAKLGADPAVVGSTLTINGHPATVVGIAPPELRIPHGARNMLSADVWMPIRFTPEQLGRRRNNYLLLLGRLAPGATPQLADEEMRSLFSALVDAHPELRGENVRVAPLQAENRASVRTPLLLIFGAVCMVLLIAATNVAALLLARGVAKRREMAVRTALGGSRWATMRPALAESAVISLAGAIGGLAIALAGVRTIGTLAAARLPQLAGLGVDLRVVGFALLLALVVALGCGVVPAWRSASVDPQDALRGARDSGGGEQHRALRTLVILEIALSLILVIGAGLVLKAFAQLLRNEPGFETAHVLTLRVSIDPARYPDNTSVGRFLEPAIAAIRSVTGVQSAASISAVPYITWGNNSNTRYEGMPSNDPTQQPIVEQRVVTPDFFDLTRQRLIAGRMLRADDDDRADAPQVVVVNQALAKRDFPGRSAVGQRFYTGDTTFATIVGVVSDIRNMGPISLPQPEMYWTYRQGGFGNEGYPLMIRVRGSDPLGIAGSVRAAIRTVDPTAAVGDVRTMPDVIAQSLGGPRFYFTLLGSFAAVAIVLAIAGLYGVLSYAVAQRTREIGIRSALGSPRSALIWLVTGEGLRLVGSGLVLGLAGGAAVTRLMAFMLYGVSPLDRSTWVLSAALMGAAGLLAAVVPALRAARVDPLLAIRADG